ncbi:ankyrin repeat domain-containing protein [Stackebrandtia nassauensis]|uniref:Uncharacterized protein n=1 Tax=Stackebrandtia nassauensis (strain DSM 44728 / CIP 108903 / NRRL B-16338 / NBRC 102104 / LLR-40K-21) TaxID=446470 RepID=D3Q1H8_STANL|nr:ankyrin repeat domain-containing protein [Stackebrandtia nassauensis]ADD39826.1 hypothetical protein Snas_0105 [Stackebrandtia nassauensis DSM 44728]
MEVDEILECLVALETGARQQKPDESRYVLIETEWDGESSGTWSASDDPVSRSLVLDALASKVYEYGDLLAELDDDEHPLLASVSSPERKALAQVLLGLQEAFQPLSDVPVGNPFLDDATTSQGAARPVVVVRDAESQGLDFTWAVMELAPRAEPEGDDRALLAATARGDDDAIAAALRSGADANALDAEGMTPLHHAVAHRRLEAVAMLLKAGADPNAQADFRNAPCFASLDGQGRVHPGAARIDDDEHWWIIGELLEGGADVNALDPRGSTLVDLAIATVPYPDQVVAYLRDRGGRHASLARREFTEHLSRLSPGDWDRQAVSVNEVRYLLENEGPVVVTDALHLLLKREWTEDEVSAETLFELTDLLLSHGARDNVATGQNPLDRAYELFGNGKRPQYQVVTYRLRKAGFARSIRSMLEWLPEGDVAAQRAHLAELRERLEASGPQPEALYWLLSPRGWSEHEIGGEFFGELIDVLLSHGGQNVVVNGRTPLGWSRIWLGRGGHPQYRIVVDRLLAAGFTYSARDYLDRIPLGDVEEQREFLPELRERLEAEGPQPEAMHWLLSPNSKWSPDEVSGEIMGELTELLLEYGGRDTDVNGTRPLDRAINRVKHDGLANYQPVVNRLRAAGFRRGGQT